MLLLQLKRMRFGKGRRGGQLLLTMSSLHLNLTKHCWMLSINVESLTRWLILWILGYFKRSIKRKTCVVTIIIHELISLLYLTFLNQGLSIFIDRLWVLLSIALNLIRTSKVMDRRRILNILRYHGWVLLIYNSCCLLLMQVNLWMIHIPLLLYHFRNFKQCWYLFSPNLTPTLRHFVPKLSAYIYLWLILFKHHPQCFFLWVALIPLGWLCLLNHALRV